VVKIIYTTFIGKCAIPVPVYPGTGFSATSRQPTRRADSRRQAFTRPANEGGKEMKQQLNPALRIAAGRYMKYMLSFFRGDSDQNVISWDIGASLNPNGLYEELKTKLLPISR
jgi:hypothetical protein